MAFLVSHATSPEELSELVHRVGHLLPAQGPITAFVHHNTLHSFEDRPFEEAVVAAGTLFGAEPFLAEATYRQLCRRGRILDQDLKAVIARYLGDGAQEELAPGISRLALWKAHMRQELEAPDDVRCLWVMEERRWLQAFLPDLDQEARLRLLETTLEPGEAEGSAQVEAELLSALWQACQILVQSTLPPTSGNRAPDRTRAVAATSWVAECLQVFTAAFLDQGLSDWNLPHQGEGMFRAFLLLHRRGWCPDRRWRQLRLAAKPLLEGGISAEAYLRHALEQKGMTGNSAVEFLFSACEGVRSFAGMVHQLEAAPHRAPVQAPACRLLDFLALAVFLQDCEAQSLTVEQAEPDAVPLEELALRRSLHLFLMLQRFGRSAAWLEGLPLANRQSLLAEAEACHSMTRRRLFQEAFERRYRKQVLNALAQAPIPVKEVSKPSFDVVLCLDEREESLRRHLEEADPRLRTFGTAGHFGVSLRYRGAGDAHWTNLGPAALPPRYWVEAVAREEVAALASRHRRHRRILGQVRAAADRSSRSLFLGALIHVVLGLWGTLPLVFSVFAPRRYYRLSGATTAGIAPLKRTRLWMWQDQDPPQENGHPRFTVADGVELVATLLGEIGLDHPSRLVLLLGHGSHSRNNPQEAAYDCGACGGGRGGPNARVVARLANDSRVRAGLRERGIVLADEVYFLGGWHNTCDDAMQIYDLEDLPATHQADAQELQAVLEKSRRGDARERSRRFLSAPLHMSPERALAHVEGRANDLAQARPECGHATNAMLLVGRRDRSRALFLDRRCFLSSYDPHQDPDGSHLRGILATALPVCAGINLEYYFSFVDPHVYGCGTKLPHNICALLGVVDGQRSDLRSGLPRQMTEIHEPMRLLVVVEAPLDRLQQVLEAEPQLLRLVEGRWVQLAALEPDRQVVNMFEDGAFRRHFLEAEPLPKAKDSHEVFAGRRGHLRPALLVGGTKVDLARASR